MSFFIVQYIFLENAYFIFASLNLQNILKVKVSKASLVVENGSNKTSRNSLRTKKLCHAYLKRPLANQLLYIYIYIYIHAQVTIFHSIHSKYSPISFKIILKIYQNFTEI